MGMNVGSSKGSGEPDVILDINTTPLIDVMLVLLVMLIITIPIQLHSVNLNMPTGNPPPPLVKPEVVKLDIDAGSVVYWNGDAVPDRAALEEKLAYAAAQARAARTPPAARQGREVRDRRRRDGVGAAARPDQDRHRRQRAVHQRLVRRTAPRAPAAGRSRHDMDYARQQRDPARHMIGIAFVILVHALVIWALMSGLGKNIVQIIKKPLNATIIEEVKLPPPPPPPPPPKKIIEQPKVPDAARDVRAAARHPGADHADGAGDLRGHADRADRAARDRAAAAGRRAARAAQARRSVAASSACRGDDPSYPREAIRAGVAKGRVVARLQIDEKGNVTDVNITVSDPPRVFDKVVRAALEGWKFKAEGEKYVGEVEINFTLKDE